MIVVLVMLIVVLIAIVKICRAVSKFMVPIQNAGAIFKGSDNDRDSEFPSVNLSRVRIRK